MKLIFYDITRIDNPGGGGMGIDTLNNVQCNYWNHYYLNARPKFIYPWEYFKVAPYWDPQTGICQLGGKGLYDDGIDFFANENYIAAKAAFLELIETYPDDSFSIAALHELFALEQFMDNTNVNYISFQNGSKKIYL
jgi:hypothetical protein